MAWLSTDVKNQISIEKFFSFFEARYEEGFDFPGEAHNFWECLYVINGGICVSGDERVYHMQEGGLIFHKPLEFHKFRIDHRDGAALLIFSFSLEGECSDCLKNKVFRLSGEQRAVISALLDYLHRQNGPECFAPGSPVSKSYLRPCHSLPTYSQMLTTYIYQLFLSLIEEGNISAVSMEEDAAVFSSAVSFMNSHICEQPSVSEIARFCRISETGLKRIFHKYAGISVHRYFLKLKIKTAAELLGNGLNVTNTAEKLGFSSQAYFSAAFRREMEVRPSEYGKMKREA